ncbi:hypothetical protein [uncultured Duncaniella sp.]|nr:hypothetical protein [uncultured Duncaniella sp.]
MAPWAYTVYDPDFNLLSSYTYGDHFPKEERWQEPCRYSPGNKAYAIYHVGFDVLVPCEVIGPITEEFVRKQHEADDLAPDTCEEFVEYKGDWDWDTVIVKSLVRIKNAFEELPELIEVNRINIFPMDVIHDLPIYECGEKALSAR